MTVYDAHSGAGSAGASAALRPFSSPPGPDRLDIRVIFAIFRRRFRLFFYTSFIIFDISVLLALYLPARYTATAEIVLNMHDVPVTPSSEKAPTDVPNSTSDVDTEIQILTSRGLATQVVDYLHLEQAPDMRAMMAGGRLTGLKRMFGMAPPPPAALAPEEQAKLRDIVISLVVSRLDVQRLSSAFALGVSYTDSDPVRAAAVANAFAHLYTDGQLKLKRRQNLEAAQVLGSRIAALQKRAQGDFDALQQYRISNNLLSTTGATLTEQEISAYNQQVATARAEAAEDAARLATAQAQLRRGSTGDDVGEALVSPVIHGLRAQRAVLSAKFADYAGRYGPRNPDLVDTLRQLTEVDGQIQAEINRTISNLSAKVTVSQQHLASLTGSLSSARQTLAQNNASMVQLDDLQRRANTSQSIYDSYLNRYKEVVAADGAERADSRTVSDARIPGAPSFPKPILFLGLGALLGIGLGIVAALLAEITFSGLTTGQEVEERLDVPYLGGVPELASVSPRGDDPLDTMRAMPRSPFAEAVRGVLGAVRNGGGRNQVLFVTSGLPEEGKTTLAACLAQAAATGGERAIVIDFDTIRRRYSKELAGLPEKKPGVAVRKSAAPPTPPGLREVLTGAAPLAEAIVKGPSGVSSLPITTPFDKEDLLIDRVRMQAILGELRTSFDLIVIDSAPILPVAETRQLALLADRIVLVGRWRRTSDKALLSALRLLPPAVHDLIGVSLTRIDMRKQISFGYGDATSFYKQYKGYYAA